MPLMLKLRMGSFVQRESVAMRLVLRAVTNGGGKGIVSLRLAGCWCVLGIGIRW